MFSADASGATGSVTYVDDVFSAYTYTGTGAALTINNGIDLSTKGGMVWFKERGGTLYGHDVYDTERGRANNLKTNSTAAQNTGAASDRDLKTFDSTGFTLGTTGNTGINVASSTYVAWTFRKAAKFFDVVTYTGNATAGRVLSHSLGIAPGMVVIKRTDAVLDWYVYHVSTGTTQYLKLNQTAAAATFGVVTATSATDITLPNDGSVNGAGASYVAYLFAHDTGTDGLIKCGSFTTDVSGNATVNLGWEPQFLLVKLTGLGDNWYILDTRRGWLASPSTGSNYLCPNTTAAEASWGAVWEPKATGFNIAGQPASQPIIYMAIRRPNKPPTLGTQVYNAIARTGTGAAATVTGVGFPPDLAIPGRRDANSSPFFDRLRGPAQYLATTASAGESPVTNELLSFDQNGISLGDASINALTNYSGIAHINWFFKRAPGVFDVVCYAGTGATHNESHSLGVAPELAVFKSRNNISQWGVYHSSLGFDQYVLLNSTAAKVSSTAVCISAVSTTTFTLNIAGGGYSNQSTYTYVAYLFATKPGVSKVGSYTGNGSSLTVDCGFTTGARFIMIKRTDSTGDWFVWDTVRGIVAGNDPHLSLNTTAAEVTTDDTIDTDTTGFVVNQVAATNVNVTGATYIYLAFA